MWAANQLMSLRAKYNQESGTRWQSLPLEALIRGVAPPPRSSAHNMEQLWQGTGRSFCLKGIHPLSAVVLSGGDNQCSGAKTCFFTLAESTCACISTSPSTSSLSQNSSGGLQYCFWWPLSSRGECGSICSTNCATGRTGDFLPLKTSTVMVPRPTMLPAVLTFTSS